MSPQAICDPVCLHVFVFMSLHLHLNAKSVCLRGLARGLCGRLAARSHDEQTLQGRIISYYPEFPVMRGAGERNWIRPTGRNERSHSLDLLDRPPLPAPCLPPVCQLPILLSLQPPAVFRMS